MKTDLPLLDEFEWLSAAVIDETASAEDRTRFNALLRGHPELAQVYFEQVAMHAWLTSRKESGDAAGDHAGILTLYRQLARLRRERPELTDPAWPAAAQVHAPDDADAAHRAFALSRGDLRVLVNLTLEDWPVPAEPQDTLLVATDDRIRIEGARVVLPPDSAAVIGPAA